MEMEVGQFEGVCFIERDQSVMAAIKDMLRIAEDSRFYMSVIYGRACAACYWSDAEIAASALRVSLADYVKMGRYVRPRPVDELRKQWKADFWKACQQ